MATDLIRYDLLVQDALRGVVRSVLSDAAKNGLQGDHHFFITFRTTEPGLRLSDRMRERYPEEMTIILQHQFWDLGVTDHAFEVGLSFSNKPERLLVPFTAITTFHDPSVQFGLKFDPTDKEGQDTEDDSVAAATAMPPEAGRDKGKRSLQAVESQPAATPIAALPAPSRAKPLKPTLAKIAPPADHDGKDAGRPEPGEPQKVVSIDAFRKKP